MIKQLDIKEYLNKETNIVYYWVLAIQVYYYMLDIMNLLNIIN